MILKKHRRWIIYLMSCLLFSFSQFYRSSIAVISPNLVEAIDLDAKTWDSSPLHFFMRLPMQIPVGFYLDSIGTTGHDDGLSWWPSLVPPCLPAANRL
jgi:hypothetical protein